MRYLLHIDQRSELAARQDYLYGIFHMYFLPGKPEGSYIPLYPIGPACPDILFITGHNDAVDKYLKGNIASIHENTIVITSCMGQTFRKYTARKKIYVPSANYDFCILRNGKPYGFDFSISDAELDFYNASGTISEKIHSAYVRLL